MYKELNGNNNIGKLAILAIIFATGLMMANIMAQKVIVIFGIFAPLGIFAYPITFLMTDTITEVWGRKVAQKVVLGGLIANIIMVVGLHVSTFVPAAPVYGLEEEYAMILAGVPRIALASLISYMISQMVDVNLFSFLKKKTKGKHLWLRNNISTMTSQVIDSVVFIAIAFAGTMPLPALLMMMASQYVMKFMFALCDTPFVYLTVAWARKKSHTSNLEFAREESATS